MKVLQILPELNSGGVERGTLELAGFLVRHGHTSLVVSHGGRLVEALEQAGSQHLALPVHRKNPLTLLQVPALRRLLAEQQPDILHIRSRAPGWVAWLAWKGMDPRTRPRLVSTVHGFYSVNRYSAVMTRGERVIAVSDSIRRYILEHYPDVEPSTVRVIHRGVDPSVFPAGYTPDEAWMRAWHAAQPQLEGRIPLLLPGRITRWKGQEHFLQIVADLIASGRPVHGLLAGETHPKKRAFLEELRSRAAQLGIAEHVTFLGHRSDLREVMAASAAVFSLSLDPEAFGRVSLEAMALGKPVIAYDHGGVAEQLRALFPAGLVPPGDIHAATAAAQHLLDLRITPESVGRFTLEAMQNATLDVYQELLGTAPNPSLRRPA